MLIHTGFDAHRCQCTSAKGSYWIDALIGMYMAIEEEVKACKQHSTMTEGMTDMMNVSCPGNIKVL